MVADEDGNCVVKELRIGIGCGCNGRICGSTIETIEEEFMGSNSISLSGNCCAVGRTRLLRGGS